MTGSTTRSLIYQTILERNARETDPFREIHESYAKQSLRMKKLQSKLDHAEKEISRLQQELNDNGGVGGRGSNSKSTTAALKSEARLRDKLEKLQDDYDLKVKEELEDKADASRTAQRLTELQDINSSHEDLILELRQEIERNQRAISHLQGEVDDAKSRTLLAEKQYDGLKVTIRSLQQENDEVKKEKSILEERLVTDKGRMVEEMNNLTEMVEQLKKENEMQKSNIKPQVPTEPKTSSWFGAFSSTPSTPSAPVASITPSSSKSPEDTKHSPITASPSKSGKRDTPKVVPMNIVMPSKLKKKVQAHMMEAMCLRYDESGQDLVVTAGSDSTVKVFDTSSGSLRSTLYGTSGQAMMACDIYGQVVIGASTDKTCRVWNASNERMLHHLVGHLHKVTCVRLCAQGEAVLTGSADRSLKVWDISRQTYRQTTTLRHGSTPHCVDVGSDSFSAVSGHMDGGLRFWDLRTGNLTEDLSDIHSNAISSVQFSPASSTQVLTNGIDSCLKLVDVRTGKAIHTFRHPEFTTAQSYSSAVISPDGRYVASGSSSNGKIFVWDAVHGTLKAELGGHETGVCCIDWGGGGTSGQQVATIDRRGKMILWA